MKVGEIKKSICTFIIVREWLECEEFLNVKKIIVVGDKLQALIINLLFFKKTQEIYYCDKNDFEKKYSYKKNVKWIVFYVDKNILLKDMGMDVLIFPNLLIR